MPDKLDLYSSHRFAVELKGVTEALFTECSGLQIELEVQEWQEGGLNNVVHRLPGRVKTAPNLVLKRGLATDDCGSGSSERRAAPSNATISRSS
jgi:phage tail-like protein